MITLVLFLRVTSKIILDQEVNNRDYQNVGRGLIYYLDEGMRKGAQGSFKYQEGGDSIDNKNCN